MSKISERALLLAAGEIPPGDTETQIRIETDGHSIGVVVTNGTNHKLLPLRGISDLKTLVKVSQEFLNKAGVSV